MTGLLRAPFTRRAWAETLYLLAGVPLAILGLAYAALAAVVGVALSITRIGGPATAALLRGASRIGELHLLLASAVLGERISCDANGHRAFLHLLVRPLATLTGVITVYSTWLMGALLLTYPIQLQLDLNRVTTQDSSGIVRHGLTVGGLYIDTLPRSLPVALVGLALLLLAPPAVRAAVRLDLTALHTLLDPPPGTDRIRELEASRSYAVQDAAATLRRIERDLHDGAQVRLIALTMHLSILKETLPTSTPEATLHLVDSAHGDARAAIAELRELVRGIHPPTLDKGLDVALATLAARSPVPAELDTDLPARPSPAIESIAYFCVAELLANSAKHAHAHHVLIEASQPGNGTLLLRVTDDGQGGARTDAGSGLSGLSERVRTVDGDLHVDSPPGGPTAMTVTLPLAT